jgi:FkbM family methyltransferase
MEVVCPESYSQLGQDLKVLDFYNKKQGGFYVEIGASDGITLSNTYLLEKEYKWKGICVEPIPKVFSELCQNRPNSNCCNDAVFNTSGSTVSFHISHASNLLSGINSTIDCGIDQRIVDNNKTEIFVNTITLSDLLKKYNAPQFIEYLSLDTEGSELQILKSVDFNEYTFGIIDVEHNYVEPRRTQMRNLLISNGYVFLHQNDFDDSYKHASL